MAYELYQSRYKGFEIDAQLDKVTENATKINALSTSYDANKVMMPDNTTLPSYLANNTFNIDVSEYPGQILEKKGDGYYVPETDLSDYDTSTEVDTKIAAAVYTLPPATDTTLGGVKPDGTTITIDTDGTLHGASAIDNLDDIGDVNVSGATDGQALVYDATNEEWIPGTAGSDSPPEIAIQTSEPTGDEVFWIDPTEGMPVLPDDGRQIIGGGELEFYTADERVVGYWTNGKPLYRKQVTFKMPKVITDGVFPENVGTRVTDDTVDFCMMEKASFTILNTTNMQYQPLPYFNNAGRVAKAFIQIQQGVDNKAWIISTTNGTAFSEGDCIAIVYYTKVKDTAVTNVNNYSTDEIRTNKTWIDGKPVYRKVVQTTTPNVKNSMVEIFNYSNLNVDTMIIVDGYIYDTEKGQTSRVPINQYETGIMEIVTVANSLLKNIRMKVISTMIDVSLKCTLIIEYTKTTD